MAKKHPRLEETHDEELKPIDFTIEEQEALEPYRTRLTVEIPASAFQETYEELLEEVRKHASFPGFRKGKAPRALLEQRVGKHLVDETANNCVERLMATLLKDQKLIVLGQVQMKERTGGEDGTPLRVVLEYEHFPQFELGDYRGITFEDQVTPVEDAEVMDYLEQLRRRFTPLSPVTGRTVQMGDIVTVSMHATINLVPWEPGCHETRSFFVEASEAFPGLPEALVGLLPNAGIVHEMALPEDYRYDPDAAGETVVFRIDLKQVQEQRLPDFDDTFAQEFLDVEDMQRAKEWARERIEEQRQSENQSAVRRKAVDALAEMHRDVVPPPKLVEAEKHMIREKHEQFFEQLRETGRLSSEDESWKEEVLQGVEEEARQAARVNMVLETIAIAEGVTVDDDELDLLLTQMAVDARTSPKRYIQEAQESGLSEFVRQRILREKVLSMLIEGEWGDAKTPAQAEESNESEATTPGETAEEDQSCEPTPPETTENS